MKTNFQKLALKLLVLATLIILLDVVIGSTLRLAYFKQTSGLQYRTTYSLEQTTEDMLFFGSSRCNHHYDPRIFENSLKLKAYNAGRDGNGLPYHYAVLKGVLTRYTPKIVILDLLENDLNEGSDPYERLSSLLPYYKSHPEMRDVINTKSQFERLKLLSSIYPFNSSLLTIAVGNMSFNEKRTEDIKGYLPLIKNWNEHLARESTLKLNSLDNNKLSFYESFLSECRERNIEVYVLISPCYEAPENDQALAVAQQVAKKQGATFWNFSKNKDYLKTPRYFADQWHLNTRGAERYSLMIAQRIKYSSKAKYLRNTDQNFSSL